MDRQNCYLGFDIGGTKTLAILIDAEGQIVAEHQEPTQTAGGLLLVDQIERIANHLSKGRNLAGIGLGVPASVDPKTKSLSLIPNIDNMEGTSFYKHLQDRFSVALSLDNDVNCAAMAEAGAADPLAFIAIGTGIGMGLVAGGRLLQGHRGSAGEIAYMPLGGDACAACQNGNGALEEQLGGAAWRRLYSAMGGSDDPDLAALFHAPDAIFNDLILHQADLLARALLGISSVVAPEMFILGGSIGNQPLLLAALNCSLCDYFIEKPLVKASVWGGKAGALGAARSVSLQVYP